MTADGQIRHVDADNHADLFWGLFVSEWGAGVIGSPVEVAR